MSTEFWVWLLLATELLLAATATTHVVLRKRDVRAAVHWAAAAQAEQLLAGGCCIVLTRPPFDHTKLMLVDDIWCLFGSANWDPRSLRLNFEFNVECYDRTLNGALQRFVDGRVRSGRELSAEEMQARPWSHKIRDGVVRLFSPYL